MKQRALAVVYTIARRVLSERRQNRLRFLLRWPRARWGNLRRREPFSAKYGFERGMPVDRIYIEDFLARHAADIRGAVLEVKNAECTSRLGALA